MTSFGMSHKVNGLDKYRMHAITCNVIILLECISFFLSIGKRNEMMENFLTALTDYLEILIDSMSMYCII